MKPDDQALTVADTAWANAQMMDLLAEREKLASVTQVQQRPPQIDVQTAIAYRRDADRVIADGSLGAKQEKGPPFSDPSPGSGGKLVLDNSPC